MGKLIAVWGAPGTGKTAFSIKLAETLYDASKGRCAVIVVFTDNVTPMLPVVFPNFRSEDTFSIGSVLSKPDFYADDVVSNVVMVKGRMNLGYMGYKEGENSHTYPEYTEEKAKYFYEVLLRVADYVVVDCMAMPDNDRLTKMALQYADKVVHISAPDLKCISYEMSQMKMMISCGYIKAEDISVMNNPNGSLTHVPVNMKGSFDKIQYTLNFSNALLEQYLEGNMYQTLKDKKYNQTMRAIAQIINERR